MRQTVVVLGAGVVGLSTALAILRSRPGARVVVVAEDFTPDTTSDGAGALWRPVFLGDEPRAVRWGRETFRQLKALAGGAEAARAGVSRVRGTELFMQPADPPEWRDDVIDFEYLDALAVKGLQGSGMAGLGCAAVCGHRYTSFMVDMPRYMRFLMQEIEKLGGVFRRQKVDPRRIRLRGVPVPISIIINCLGLGAERSSLVDTAR